jgi:glycosyltransferase involved in cell wall biosynthesis
MPFFSIIIPLYNKENYIENTLKSVLNQSFTDFEVIIVNDGSTDNGEQKVLSFNDSRIIYQSKQNGGVSSARNVGIDLAQSNYITFIDADDYWYPNFLETMHENIINFTHNKVFSAAIEIETPKKVFPAKYSIKKSGKIEIVDYFKASSKQTVICTSCAVFHHSIFKEIGNFDTTIKSGQDTDLWIRIGLKYPVVFSWEILARYIYDPQSLSKNKKYNTKKLDFAKFEKLEKTNADLKLFLDLNRFSLAIKSKISNDIKSFYFYYESINLKNLSLKKRLLLYLNPFILQVLTKVKLKFVELGLGNSVFK